TYRKEQNRKIQHRKSAPYQRTPEQNKGKQQRHFSSGLTIFKKTVAKPNVECGNRQAGSKGSKKAAPVSGFGCSAGGKRYSTREKRCVVPPHANLARDHIKSGQAE